MDEDLEEIQDDADDAAFIWLTAAVQDVLSADDRADPSEAKTGALDPRVVSSGRL